MNSKTLLTHMPEYYRNSRYVENILEAIADEFNRFEKDCKQKQRELRIYTAENDLGEYEKDFVLPVNNSYEPEWRISKIIGKLRGQGIITIQKIKDIAEAYSNGEVSVTKFPREFKLVITFVGTIGIPPNIEDLKATLDSLIAGDWVVEYKFKYNTWQNVKDKFATWQDVYDHMPTWGDVFESKLDKYNEVLKPTFTITIDDGTSPVNDVIAMLNKYNIKAAFCIEPTKVGDAGFLTLEEINSLKADGHEIIMHGDTQLTTSNANSILTQAKDYATTNGFNDTIYVYPDGNFGDDKKKIENITKNYFNYALNVFGGYISYKFDRDMDLPRLFPSSECDISTVHWVKDIVDNCKNAHGCLVIGMHGWEFDTNKTYIEDLIKYLLDNDFETIKLTNAIEMYK